MLYECFGKRPGGLKVALRYALAAVENDDDVTGACNVCSFNVDNWETVNLNKQTGGCAFARYFLLNRCCNRQIVAVVDRFHL